MSIDLRVQQNPVDVPVSPEEVVTAGLVEEARKWQPPLMVIADKGEPTSATG
jgi:hypothetical protein